MSAGRGGSGGQSRKCTLTNWDRSTRWAGSRSCPANRYDLWRVICRGPVDRSILLSYAATDVEQVDPAAFNQAPSPTGRYPTVRVPAAEKAVYWVSPYTG